MAMLGNLLLSIFVGAVIGCLIGCAIIGLIDLYAMYVGDLIQLESANLFAHNS